MLESERDVVATRELPEAVKRNLDQYAGCVGGAALVSDVERMLRTAGFCDISVFVKEESREFIKDWFPGSGIEDYVVSASIEAKKPGEAPKRALEPAGDGSGCC